MTGMNVIRVRYGSDSPRQVADTVRYISHREEGLEGGQTRAIYGVGSRFRELRGDERGIISRLTGDSDGLERPLYYRLRLTVNDQLAGRLAALARADLRARERVLRDAVEKTLRGVARSMQGVYVIHEHGGQHRPSGHPHVYVYLSPLQTHGDPVRRKGPRWLDELRTRWGQELDRAATRYEQRVRQPADRQREPASLLRTRLRSPSQGERLQPDRDTSRKSLLPWIGAAVSIARGHANSERMTRRVVWRAAAAAIPSPLRMAARAVRRILPGER